MARSISPDAARRAGLLAVVALLAVAIAAAGRRLRARGVGLFGRGAAGAPEEQTFTCSCGAGYRVSGTDRHRVYWPLEASAAEPVMDDRCVACETPLPEGRATTAGQPAG
jgi:hypothetical protein